MTYRVFSVGECPVCPGFGVVLVLGRLGGDGVVFMCPACEAAWSSPPVGFDEANSLEVLAPGGVRLPTDAELAAFPTAKETESAPWEPELNGLLGRRSSNAHQH